MPDGFCVSTHAFRRVVAEAPPIGAHLDRLSRVEAGDHAAIRTLSAEVRRVIEGAAVPDELAAEIGAALARLGEPVACAVRSSATAEDLPTASFAGQQDSYLNIAGLAEILLHVRRCWASLFTERAVIYRCRNGFDHRKVRMAVVVQRMVFPDAAGMLFTADPVTSNRKVATVEAGWGSASRSSPVWWPATSTRSATTRSSPRRSPPSRGSSRRRRAAAPGTCPSSRGGSGGRC
ncbi:PEP/pyruvate-binding domain-containing protein [Nonomuraea thailandensis]